MFLIDVALGALHFGVTVAEVNLKLVWDVISAIKVGETGSAFVLDPPSRLVAHPDISLVLRGADNATPGPSGRSVKRSGGPVRGLPLVGMLRAVPLWRQRRRFPGLIGRLWSSSRSPRLPDLIDAALWRTGRLLLAGGALAGLLAYALARRVTEPFRLLEGGTERIGAGRFDYRIEIRTGDELQRLTAGFDAMAADPAVSQERQEHIARLKRSWRHRWPNSSAAKATTACSRAAAPRSWRRSAACGASPPSRREAPKEVMEALWEYDETLGRIITRYNATLTSASGGGLMALVNAPVPVDEKLPAAGRTFRP